MGNYIMVDGGEFAFVNPAASGTISIIGLPSVKVKCDNKGIYKSTVAVSISGYSDAQISSGSGAGTFVILPTRKVMSESLHVICENDISIVPIIVTGTNNSPPPPTMAVAVFLKCKSAGQTKVKAT